MVIHRCSGRGREGMVVHNLPGAVSDGVVALYRVASESNFVFPLSPLNRDAFFVAFSFRGEGSRFSRRRCTLGGHWHPNKCCDIY